MGIAIAWLVFIFGFGFLRVFLRKRFGIDQEEQAGVPVKRFERWNGAVMTIVIITAAIFLVGSLEVFFFSVFWIFFIGSGVQIYLEWKYLRGSRKYQASIVYFTVTALALIIFITFVRLQTGVL
ncbi:DUF4181 domain-containing protein [Planococcus sp. CPCC 101016]|uniref:DUF4181 domain-containing protein n=1 Tax=Planococcus sp. CPCC 101016 TaxID=2599617 RepID=UPI0011B841C9|nr:DUF4181 domain-containing protein [Planococcus sp. CPCC 101016]TWT06538.1 DUF4181 domain-containing protein [Planococcus sp. CPCC 101016]